MAASATGATATSSATSRDTATTAATETATANTTAAAGRAVGGGVVCRNSTRVGRGRTRVGSLTADRTVAQVRGALGPQAARIIVTGTACRRGIDTAVHIARTHVDSAGMVVVTAKASDTATPVGIVVAIIRIVPIVAIVEVVVPGIPPT